MDAISPAKALALLSAVWMGSASPLYAQLTPPGDQTGVAVPDSRLQAMTGSYRNVLSAGEIAELVAAADLSQTQFRATFHRVVGADPARALSAYMETLGQVPAEYSRLLASETLLLAPGAASAPAVAQASTGLGWGSLALATGGVGAAALALGGGGGGETAVAGDTQTQDPAPDPDQAAPTPTVVYDPNAEYPLTDEHRFTGGYDLSRGHVPHGMGLSGAGSRIAVLDSGINAGHEAFRQANIAGVYNAPLDSTALADVNDEDGHGTHVAGILASDRDDYRGIGYAYGADYYIVRLSHDDGDLASDDATLARAFAYGRNQGVDYFNNSWGVTETIAEGGWTRNLLEASYPAWLGELKQGAANDRVYIWAAGNSGAGQPNMVAAMPQLVPELATAWVAVANVDPQTGLLVSSSNRCGQAADWCISAPGTEITSADARGGDTYSIGTGTSQAAPAVTGGLALVKQQFPMLSNQQTVERLFLTANKAGSYADSASYGQGLMDLEQAMQPLGSTALLTDSGAAYPTATTSLTLGSAFGDGGERLGSLKTMVVDSQGAGFDAQLASYQQPAPSSYDAGLSYRQLSARPPETLRLGGRTLSYGASSVPGRPGLALLGWQHGLGEATVGYAERPEELDLWALGGQSQQELLLTAPYWVNGSTDPQQRLSLVRQQIPLGRHWRLAAQAIDAGDTQGAGLSLSRTWAQPYWLALELGTTRTRGEGLFDTASRGALALGEQHHSRFAGVKGELRLERFSLRHAIYGGLSRVAGAGLIQEMGEVVSSQWSLSAQYDGQHHQLGLHIHQPLRVERAEARLRLADHYADGAYQFRDTRVSLTPSGRQINYELFYHPGRLPLDGRFSLLMMTEPGHHRQAGNEYALMISAHYPL